MRDFFGTSEHWQWGLFSQPSQDTLQRFSMETDNYKSPFRDEVSFVYYIQYHLHLQLKKVSNYAQENGIVLMGDLPIGTTNFLLITIFLKK